MDKQIKDDLFLNSVLETSRVVNHDLFGVVHVIDFCIDELSLIDNNNSNPYIERIGQSVDQIKSIIENYGNFIKSLDHNSQSIPLKKLLEQIAKQIKVVNRRLSEKINFEISLDKSYETYLVQKNFRSCLYGFLSVVIKNHFKAGLNNKINIVFNAKENVLEMMIECSVSGSEIMRTVSELGEESSMAFKEEFFLKKCMQTYGSTCLSINDRAGSFLAKTDLEKFKYV